MSTFASAQARGERLQQLRKLTRLSRSAIERKYNVSASTINSWENPSPTRSGLTEDGARRIIHLFQEELIDCSLNWLLYGEGTPPKRRDETPAREHSKTVDHSQFSIKDEVETFIKSHAEAVAFEAKDDSMVPMYLQGDTVAGVRYYAKDIPNLVSKDCIIETRDGRTYFRKLMASTIPNRYNLVSINPETKIERPILYEIDVVTCAPVTRIWRGKKWW